MGTQTLIDMTDLTDVMLIVRVGSDPNNALKELQRRYGTLIIRIVATIAPSREVDDVCQDVWLQILRKWDTYSSDKGQVMNWLINVAKHRAIDHIRKMINRDKMITKFQDTSPPSELRFLIDEEVNVKERHQLVMKAINTLPEFQREVVILHFFNNMSQREIARHLNTPLGSTKTRLEGGLHKLRTHHKQTLSTWRF